MAKAKGETPKSTKGANTVTNGRRSRQRVDRPYPRASLEDAIKIPFIIKEKNGGNSWTPDEIASALGMSKNTNPFFYLAAASRDFGFTEGGRDSAKIALTDLGRDLAYAPNKQTEDNIKRRAFQSIDIFRRVLEYYKGSKLPEMKYLSNTLQREFQLHPETHDEFSDLFRKNSDYLGIGEGYAETPTQAETGKPNKVAPRDVVTLAEPEKETGLRCFVIMPFRERDPKHQQGFFDEVLRTLIVPAGRNAGFSVKTANRQGTEVIHSTIVNDLLDADLVVADLTEHNPNVLFELGMRMAHDKPVALIRSKGTGPIFDVDNMLRVLEYDPALWPSSVERDLPKLAEHIEATWKDRDSEMTYMKLLRRQRSSGESQESK
jgi:hypothetical protein